jgi:hypothetical protein
MAKPNHSVSLLEMRRVCSERIFFAADILYVRFGAASTRGRASVQDTAVAPGVEMKTRVFISYSRKDMAFADRLEAALKVRGFEVLIDREEIYALRIGGSGLRH